MRTRICSVIVVHAVVIELCRAVREVGDDADLVTLTCRSGYVTRDILEWSESKHNPANVL